MGTITGRGLTGDGLIEMLGAVTNVLFVCIGNSCRSQMAEGFARKYGADVLHAWSAGLAPAPIVQPLTVEVMRLKNIEIGEQFPKSVDELELNAFEIIVNMSGVPLAAPVRGEVLTWNVADPMMQSEEVYLQVRDQIEGLVMQLIMNLRRPAGATADVAKSAPVRPTNTPSSIRAGRVAPVGDGDRTSESSQRYGFGRVRKNRD